MRFGSVVEWAANSIPVSAIANFASTVRGFALNSFALPTAAVDMNSQKVTRLATGTASTDAVNKGQMDSADTATLNAAKAYTDGKSVPANVAKTARGTFSGNGSATSFNITHNLNTATYAFSLIDGANNHFILADCLTVTANTSVVRFGEAPAATETFYWFMVG